MVRARTALILDVAAVVAFVAIGRRSHGEGEAVKELLRTLAPFLIGLVAGWTIVVATSRPPAALPSGVVVWAVTVALGMILRRVAFERGTAPSFVLVATGFLGLCFLGWRLLADRVAPWGRRRAAD